jgi:hypothetical protein
MNDNSNENGAEVQKKPSCFNCNHHDPCKLRNDISDTLPRFMDFDRPGASNWLTVIMEAMAERCRYYRPNDLKD